MNSMHVGPQSVHYNNECKAVNKIVHHQREAIVYNNST